LERIDALFVQGLPDSRARRETVTLHGLVDSTVYFADRPRREIGHIPSHRFVELWSAGAIVLRTIPPNAVISFLDEDGDTSDVLVVLHEATLEGDDLTYRIDRARGDVAGGIRSLLAFHRRLRASALACLRCGIEAPAAAPATRYVRG
jgi:hypothetical protein